jgi:hypothetical protein
MSPEKRGDADEDDDLEVVPAMSQESLLCNQLIASDKRRRPTTRKALTNRHR